MIKPKFKTGDWVRVDPNSRRYVHYPELHGKLVKVIGLEYHPMFESNPSPWSLNLEGYRNSIWDIFEEDVILDPFMTAASNAVESSNGEGIQKEKGQ